MHTGENNQEQLVLFDLLDDSAELKEDFTTKNKENDSSWSEHNINNSFPTDLLIDFDRFINYLNRHPIQLTNKMKLISRRHLPSINKQLSIKATDVTNHSEQKYYPYIHFLYHIALAGSIIKVATDSPHPRLVITNRWEDYKQLTAEEKYFFLLETFWVDVDWSDILNQNNNPIILEIEDVFMKLLNAKQLQLSMSALNGLTYGWNYFFLYIEWLGLWLCETDIEKLKNENRKNKYFAKSISLTSFAEKVVPILIRNRHPEVWNIPFRSENGEINPIPGTKLPEEMEDSSNNMMIVNEDQSSQGFYEVFIDLFTPALLQKTLPRNERKYTPGAYTFKIAYSKNSWCKVNLGASHRMDDLHNIIIKSFQFDNDHLYSFFFNGKKWSRNCIVAPLDHSGDPIATEVRIGTVGLYAGMEFMYLYDYGAEWQFIVTVEHIDEVAPEPITPQLIERKGSSPEQ